MMVEGFYLFTVALFSMVLFVSGATPTSWTTSSTYCYDGQVKFENSTYTYTEGRSTYGGRVEVCYSGAYHPVCDDGWTRNDATVVCKYMGYSSPYYRAVATGGREFGLSDDAPIFQNLMCNGSEYTLSDCSGYTPNNIIGDYCSSGNNQAGVYCIEACSYGVVYFENATYGYINDRYWYGGKVSVCYEDTYHPVCDEGWTEQDSVVVCNYMYYRAPYYRAETSLSNEFGLSNKSPTLQAPMCSGDENSLKDCPGYAPNNLAGDYCIIGNNQVGVRCIEVCYNGQIRFGNSTHSYDNGMYTYGGRVEVCSGEVYYPVCDEGWTIDDSAVICRYVGYGSPYYRAETAVNGEFGFLDETPVLRNPMCNGSEYQPSDCEGYALNNVDGDYCLSGSHQVGVVCVEVCYDGQMRFGNSTGSYDNGVYTYGGRVEVCSGEVYYPVCDEGWTNNDAAVVCRYMGYGSPYYRAETAVNGEFGFLDETPVLQNPMCNGSEYQLSECKGYALNNVDGDYCLSGSHQVGVVCVEVPTPTTPCNDGDTRLEDTTYYEYSERGYVYGGRVEVCYNGVYYPVCDEGWTERDSLVVCNNVGYYGYAAELSSPGEFGLSDETPILQNPMCSGSEYYLCDCPGFALNNVVSDYCLSGQYQVGIHCIGDSNAIATTSCHDGNVRLENSTYTYYNGSYVYGGRVEICYNQTFYPVCDHGWTDKDAAVVCSNLGYYYYYYRSEATSGKEYGLADETPILQNPMCNGTEYYLSDCPGFSLNSVTSDYCLSGKYQAGVRCIPVTTPSTPCSDGNIRLENSTVLYTNTTYSYGGRVEVCYNGVYHPVCDEGWTDNDATVACNNVGYSSDYYRAIATGQQVFGLSDEPPILQRPLCHGYEFYLHHCVGYKLDDVTGDYCLSGKYQAGVYCTGDLHPTSTMACSDGEVRLENSTYLFKDGVFMYGGRAEVCYRGTFHPVCDEQWTDKDAAVVCNSIGYSTAYHSAVGTGGNQYGLSDEVPILQSPKCAGSESSLRECPSYHLGEAAGYYCQTGKFQAGATCIRDNTLQCEDGDTRLGDETSGVTTEGLNYIGGRVEVCDSGVFGAICDIGWNKDAAHAICNLVGYKDRVGVPTFGSHYGTYQGLILFQNVSCSYSTDGYECSGSVATDPDCTSEKIAGVICSATGTDIPTMDPRGGGSMCTHPSLGLVTLFFFYVLRDMI